MTLTQEKKKKKEKEKRAFSKLKKHPRVPVYPSQVTLIVHSADEPEFPEAPVSRGAGGSVGQGDTAPL